MGNPGVDVTRFSTILFSLPISLFLTSVHFLDHSSVSTVTVGPVFRLPAAAYGNRIWRIELKNSRRYVCGGM